MMKIKVWHEGMSDADTKDVAYWERNMLALMMAEGWYNDDVREPIPNGYEAAPGVMFYGEGNVKIVARYEGWRRVLSLEGGRITFHIPDDFNIGHLPQIEPNWDGHTSEDKWRMIARRCGIKDIET